MALKGLKNLHYAIITDESTDKTTYDDPKPLGPAMAFNLSPQVNSANLRADDDVLFADSAQGATQVTLNTAYLEVEVEADLLGKTVDENGGITDSGNDKPPYVAVGGQAENARGGYDYFWVYRIKFAPGDNNMQTKQETPEYATPSLEGQALPRLHDKKRKYKMWDQSKNASEEAIENWFNEVIDSDWTPSNGG